MDRIAFMIMPFNDQNALQAYDHCTRGVCEERGLLIRRADELFTVTPVWDDIVNEIHKASVVIADISGGNPNVFYELGIAHTLKPQQTVIISNDPHAETPFDIAHFRTIHYENSIQGAVRFREKLEKTLALILQDVALLYRDEFILIHKALSSAGELAQLCALIGLKKSQVAVKLDDSFEIEYDDSTPSADDGEVDEPMATYGPKTAEAMKALEAVGYVEFRGAHVILTPKGDAFAIFLEERGLVCHYLNGVKLTPGYTTILERGRPPRVSYTT